jgi:hypothetical protein
MLSAHTASEGKSDRALMRTPLGQALTALGCKVDNGAPKLQTAVIRALQKDPTTCFRCRCESARTIDACRAEVAVDPAPTLNSLDLPTDPRTITSPALRGVQQLPSSGASRSARGPTSTPPRSVPWLDRSDDKAGPKAGPRDAATADAALSRIRRHASAPARRANQVRGEAEPGGIRRALWARRDPTHRPVLSESIQQEPGGAGSFVIEDPHATRFEILAAP